MPTLSKEIISAAIFGFEAQRRKLDEQIAELRGMLSGNNSSAATPSAEPKVRKKRAMSAAGRKAIAEAQRKRWAAAKGEEAPAKKTAAKTAKKPKRKLSAAGRAAIVAALKKRWAAKKAA
jgi:peptidoglycan hydrolase CwlO-like protein